MLGSRKKLEARKMIEYGNESRLLMRNEGVHALLDTAIVYKPTWLLYVFKWGENAFLNLSNS